MLTRRRPLRSLKKDQSALALIEFAISLPVVLILALGGLEAAWLSFSHMRVNQIAVTTADNAGRISTRIDESDIDAVFAGALVIGRPIGIEQRGRVILSSVEDNAQPGNRRGQKIGWQRCFGQRNKAPKYGREGRGQGNADLRDGVGPPGRRIAAAPGTAIMFVEVSLEYEPLAFEPVIGRPEIEHESAFVVRERTDHTISNVRERPQRTC